MALHACKECGKDISTKAKECPHCGAPVKETTHSKTGCLVLILSAVIVLIFFIFSNYFVGDSQHTSSKRSSNDNIKLKSALNYLNEINEVKWIDIDGNDVYIGFEPLPSDYKIICKSAALNGNRAINFGVHVWAIDASKYHKGWRPGDSPFYYTITARYGKIEK